VSWFPDGKSIAFASHRDHKPDAISRINSDGGNLHEIASDKHLSLFFPVVSPDGSKRVVDGIKGDHERALLFDMWTQRISTLAEGVHPSVIWENPTLPR